MVDKKIEKKIKANKEHIFLVENKGHIFLVADKGHIFLVADKEHIAAYMLHIIFI
jgi:hypothetical protein